jgi:hypothetical protein
MLIIHIGLPETGMLPLQKRLWQHQERLRAAGFIYPERWQTNGVPAHNPLARSIFEAATDDGLRAGQLPIMLEEFVVWLGTEKRHHVLLSSEMFSHCLNPRIRNMFVRFLTRCTDHAPVRLLVWLRRADELAEAMYRTQSAAGTLREKADVVTYPSHIAYWYSTTMASLAQVHDDTPDLTMAFAPFRSVGALTEQMCGFLSLPSDFLDADTPVVGPTMLSFGVQTFLHRFDRLKTELQLQCGRAEWAQALARQTIALDLPGSQEDYSILSVEQRRILHAATLKSADESSITEYQEFFGKDELSGPPQRSLDEFDFTLAQFEAIQLADQQLANRTTSTGRRG